MRKDTAPPHTLSPDLLAANARLLALREQVQAAREQVQAARQAQASQNAVAVSTPDDAHTAVLRDDQAGPASPSSGVQTAVSDLPTLLAALPPHLGWGSTAVSRHLRKRSGAAPTAPDDHPGQRTAASFSPPGAVPNSDAQAVAQVPKETLSQPNAHFLLHPALALAFLRQGQTAVARLWLLLRLLDEDGRGWWTREEIEAALTDKDAPTYLCTPRYLRQLLAQGDGLFWQQDEAGKACPEPAERVWLRGQAKVAAALGLRRLRGKTVELPARLLFAPIGELRAHLYASFHSGRGAAAAPISRATLCDLSGVSPRTQQSYDARARVRVQACVAVGERVTTAVAEEHAWRHGRGSFTLTDYRGEQGAAGSVYLARRLPNRYLGPHPTGSKARRLNTQLAGLCHQGDAGNGRLAVRRRYFADGAAAAKAWGQAGGRVWAYWPGNGRFAGVCVWYGLERRAA